MCALSRARQIQDRPEEALELISEATRMAEEMNNRKLLATCQLTAVWILLENGDVTKAGPILTLAEEDVWQWDDPAMHREVMALSAQILPPDRRRSVLESFLEEGRDPDLQAEAAYHIAKLTGSLEDIKRAVYMLTALQSKAPLANYTYRLKQLQ